MFIVVGGCNCWRNKRTNDTSVAANCDLENCMRLDRKIKKGPELRC